MEDKKKVPRLRFPGFTDDWEQHKLNEYLEVSRAKNKDEVFGKEDVLSVSGDYGIVNQIEFQGRSFAGVSVAPYGVVETGDVVYTKSPLKSNPYGIIKTNKGKPGIVSTLYAVYKPLDNVYSEFVQIYFEQDARMNNYMHPLVNKGAKNDMKVSDENALKGEVCFPNRDEQIKISEYFAKLDNLITLHQRQLDNLKNLKKGCLQKMFPRYGETKPELRFPGFTDDWEQRKVSDVAEIVAGGTPSTKISSYWEPKEIPWLSSGEVHKKYITFTDNMISKEGMDNSSAKMVKENSVLIALAGQGKTRGTVAINRIPLTTNQSIAAMTFNDDIIPEFVFCNLENRYDEIRKMSSGDGARGGLNKQLVGDIEIPYTSTEEQKKIGEYFFNLDNLITLHQRELDELNQFKKGMLQQMFV